MGGASRGIGHAIAFHLASHGASILGTCSSPQSLCQIDTLAALVQDTYKSSHQKCPRVIGVAANLLSSEFAEVVADKVRDAFGGKLHIIVNNAAFIDWRAMGDLDADYVHKMLLGNVQNLVLLMDILFKRGYIQPFSRVVNISASVVRSHLLSPGMIIYAAVKSALESLTRSWADVLSLDERTRGTTANFLIVGPTASESFLENGLPEFKKKAHESRALNGKSTHNDVGWPDDVANVVGLIVSERAHWINGSAVNADGGMYRTM
ncbi:hypothetical protein FDECE_12680 [Fusarium decemcellulare]|nr:hypothetical protein FDECE_12680 [Fusarium decemcellulare]